VLAEIEVLVWTRRVAPSRSAAALRELDMNVLIIGITSTSALRWSRPAIPPFGFVVLKAVVPPGMDRQRPRLEGVPLPEPGPVKCGSDSRLRGQSHRCEDPRYVQAVFPLPPKPFSIRGAGVVDAIGRRLWRQCRGQRASLLAGLGGYASTSSRPRGRRSQKRVVGANAAALPVAA